MNKGHYEEKLSAYVDAELKRYERQAIAEHLLVCEVCRREHDELKLGAMLVSRLPAADAPAAVWANIQNILDGREGRRMGLIPDAARLSWRNAFAFVAAIGAVSVLSALIYLNLLSVGPDTARQPQDPPSRPQVQEQQPPADNPETTTANASDEHPAGDQNSNTSPATVQRPPADGPAWEVETVAGKPLIGDGTDANRIAVGELLETDARSRAKIAVANIGSVEIAPNSRVKLVGTSRTEHRLSLERGRLHAKILAPPRLFIVDTPTAKAVDLGCEYTLDVDRAGNSTLRVTSGFVALEDQGRESIVPAGMMCLTRKGKGLGTPFSAETDTEFRRALEQFDFANGGSLAVRSLLAKADFYDMVTLWHLLSRVGKGDRGAVYDQLAGYVKPPAGVTREGVLNLDKKMLEAWRAEVESVWFS